MEDINCGPLSDNMDFGGPNVVTHRSMAFMTDNAVISGTGTNMQYLLNLSIMVTIYLLPEFDVGSGPTISVDICSNGAVAEKDFMVPLYARFVLAFCL